MLRCGRTSDHGTAAVSLLGELAGRARGRSSRHRLPPVLLEEAAALARACGWEATAADVLQAHYRAARAAPGAPRSASRSDT
jgi:hypothetical protein